jgi:protein tyrosine/serine phosphatase
MSRFLVSLCTVFVISVSIAAERRVPASCGIINFGRVDERVYRGAQPDEIGMASLKQLGVKSIINLRMGNDVINAELEQAHNCSILYTNVPLAGIGRPSEEQIHQVLSLIETLPSPVFIHCQHGCDRTGTVIACYRIRHDGWSSEAALQEAKRYGLSFFERGMRGYVIDFAKSHKAETPLLSAKK